MTVPPPPFKRLNRSPPPDPPPLDVVAGGAVTTGGVALPNGLKLGEGVAIFPIASLNKSPLFALVEDAGEAEEEEVEVFPCDLPKFRFS